MKDLSIVRCSIQKKARWHSAGTSICRDTQNEELTTGATMNVAPVSAETTLRLKFVEQLAMSELRCDCRRVPCACEHRRDATRGES